MFLHLLTAHGPRVADQVAHPPPFRPPCPAAWQTRLWLAAIFAITLYTSAAAAAPAYKAIDLTGFWGVTSYGWSINNSGQITGTFLNEQNVQHAFRTSPKSAIVGNVDDLGTLQSGRSPTYSMGFAINDAGQVAGRAGANFFRTPPGAAIDPVGADLGSSGIFDLDLPLLALNNAGQVAANFRDAHRIFRAYVTAPNGKFTPAGDLGTLGGPQSNVRAINDLGQAVGMSMIDGTTWYAFRTAPNAKINPATDNLGTGLPLAINNLGQVAGQLLAGKYEHAFLTAPNAKIDPATDDLGTLPNLRYSSARAVNDRGQVVGFATDSSSVFASYYTALQLSGSSRAFLYSGGRMYDLNNITTGLPTGWHLGDAQDINDSGLIVANGWNQSGGYHAFLLVPVPEPIGLLPVAIVAAICARRRVRPSMKC